MQRVCNLVEFGGKAIKEQLGRVWNLGPVLVTQERGSNLFTIKGDKKVFDSALTNYFDFKQALMNAGITKPVIIKFSISNDRGEYGLNPISFADTVACRYHSSSYSIDSIVIEMEIIAKGRELNIFDGISDNGEREGNKEFLFWSSLF